jgi:hypothetical protein
MIVMVVFIIGIKCTIKIDRRYRNIPLSLTLSPRGEGIF